MANETGAQEIIEDIELRIAELCAEKLNDKKQVIELNDIQSILQMVGDPSDYVGGEDDFGTQGSTTNQKATHEKRLYRDTEKAVFAGVATGISNYLNIDVVIIRALFVLIFLFGGFGIPLYIILWIIIPKATSNIDRLRMQGKPITVDTLRDEVENAADRLSKGSKRFADKIRKDEETHFRFHALGRMIMGILGSGLIAFGIFLIVLFLIFGLGGFQFIPIQSDYGFLSFNDFGNLVLETSQDLKWAWISGILVVASSILFILLLGINLAFHLKNKWTGRTLATLFFIGLAGFFMAIFIGIKTGREMANEGEIETTIGSIDKDTLYIESIHTALPSDNQYEIKSTGKFGFLSLEGKKINETGIHVNYKESKDTLFHIHQNLSAHSHSHKKAIEKARHIKHSAFLSEGKLKVNTTYTFPAADKLRDQDVYLIIEVPKGKKVIWDGKRIIPDPDFGDESYIEERGYLNSDGEYEQWG